MNRDEVQTEIALIIYQDAMVNESLSNAYTKAGKILAFLDAIGYPHNYKGDDLLEKRVVENLIIEYLNNERIRTDKEIAKAIVQHVSEFHYKEA